MIIAFETGEYEDRCVFALYEIDDDAWAKVVAGQKQRGADREALRLLFVTCKGPLVEREALRAGLRAFDKETERLEVEVYVYAQTFGRKVEYDALWIPQSQTAEFSL